ncbi:MAG: iron ABC transporter permease, partial [Desulfobacterales bacterium]|nr:iron ABC transporter permease [Desulfobacterales bacterium]
MVRPDLLTVGLSMLLILLFFGALALGRVDIPLKQVVQIIFSPLLSPWRELAPDWSITTYSVIMDVRLPRILAGIMVGAALSISGAAFQGVFQNPLVSPHILGVASGAGFGAALAILFFNDIWIIHLVSFAMGLVAVGATYTLSRVYQMRATLMLVLSGIVMGSLFSA